MEPDPLSSERSVGTVGTVGTPRMSVSMRQPSMAAFAEDEDEGEDSDEELSKYVRAESRVLEEHNELMKQEGAQQEENEEVEEGAPPEDAKPKKSRPKPTQSTATVEAELLEERFRKVIAENAALCKELESSRQELEKKRSLEEDLSATWKAASAVTARQKLAIQGLAKNAQATARTEATMLVEAAQQVQELQEVLKRLRSVNRQLKFASDVQTQTLTVTEEKLTARNHRIRKLELAIFQMVYEAQSTPGLETVTAGLVAKCGPMVRSVLAREAQRQALEITAQERQSSEAAVESQEGPRPPPPPPQDELRPPDAVRKSLTGQGVAAPVPGTSPDAAGLVDGASTWPAHQALGGAR